MGEYWLQSTLSRAALAAFMMKSGGLYPKKPWPMLTMGCLGDAAAPSLTIDLQRTVSEGSIISESEFLGTEYTTTASSHPTMHLLSVEAMACGEDRIENRDKL